MGPFGRNYGSDYARDFGRGDWARQQGRWDFNAGPWRGNQGYDRSIREFTPDRGAFDRSGFDRGGYDRGFRGGDSHMREPFPTRPSHSMHPMQHGSQGYDHGYFGIDYDRDMRAGGRGYNNGGRMRYDRNFGDFRNSYLTGWF